MIFSHLTVLQKLDNSSMKIHRKSSLLFAFLLSCFSLLHVFFPHATFAQGQCLTGGCAPNITPYGGPFSTTSPTFINPIPSNWAGDYVTFNVTSGQTYEWSLCPADGATFNCPTCDYQLTLRNGTTMALLCYSDDFCSAMPKITYTATFTGLVWIDINEFNCNSGIDDLNLMWRCASCTTYNPCTTIPTITGCNVVQTSTSTGGGVWNNQTCGFATPGQERIFQFTPTTTGVHNVQVTSVAGGYVDYLYKAASGGCSNSGWICIGDINTPGTYGTLNLVAGTTYYFLLAPENTGGSVHNFQILCPTVTNPCTSISTISGCGNSVTSSHSGNGAWNTTFCGNNGFGLERVYQFTAPVSGEYTIDLLSATGGNVEYLWKDAALGCSNTGWNCIGSFGSVGIYNGSVAMNFTAGSTYYILLDPQANTVYNHTFAMRCPVPPPPTSVVGAPNPICTGSAITLTANGAIGTVRWYVGSCGGSLIGTGAIFTPSPAPTVTTKYYAANFNGFFMGLCDSVTITVEQNITSNSISPAQSVCANALPTLLAGSLPTGGNGVYTYVWQSGTDNSTWQVMTGIAGQDYQPPLLSQNTYYRRIVSAGLCNPSTSASIAVQSVPNITPAVNITASPGTTICQGNNLLFTATPFNGGPAPTYQWYVNNLAVPGQSNSTFSTTTLNDQDQVSVELFSSAICPAPTSIVSSDLTITVNPVPATPAMITNSPVCNSGNLSLSTPSVPGYSYQWNGPNGYQSTNQVDTIFNTSLADAGVYSLVVTLNNCPSLTALSVVSIEDFVSPITISSDQTLCTGSPAAVLTASIPSGGNGVYQYDWETSSNNSTWALVNSGVNTTYNPGSPTSTSYYRVIVSSGVCNPSTSSVVAVRIEQNLSGSGIAASQSLCGPGVPQVLTGTLPSGGSGSYLFDWETSADQVSWTVDPGAIQNNYTPGTISSNTYFRRTVISGVCPPIVSNVLQIQVDAPISNNSVGNAQTLCAGNIPAPFTGSLPLGGDGTYAYQWQSSLNNSSWNAIPFATSQNFSEGTIPNSTYYRRWVTSSGCQLNSNSFFISALPLLSNNTIIASQTLCQGAAASVITGTIPTGGTGSYIYNWQSSSDNSNWSVVTGFNGVSFNPGSPPSTLYLRREVISGICTPLTSNSIAIVVEVPVTNNTISASQSICIPQNANPLMGSLPAAGSGVYLYTWQSSGNNISWAPVGGGTQQNLTLTGPVFNTYYRRVVSSGVCPDNASLSVSVSVTPAITNYQITSAQTICSGTSPSVLSGISAPGGGAGTYQYQWESANDNISWSPISGQTQAQYISMPLTSDIYFRRVVTSGVCVESSTSLYIRVDQPATNNFISANQSICAGSAPAIFPGTPPTGGTGVYVYTWQSSPNNINFFNIPTGTANDYQAPILNSTVYYRRVVSSGICNPSTSASIGVIVTPVPSISISSPGVLCTGTPTQVTFNLGGQAPWDFTWTDGTNTTPVTGYTASQYLINITPTFSQTFSVSNLFSVCSGNITGNGVVTVTPLPTATMTGSQIICTGNSANLSVNFTGTGPWDIVWTNGTTQIVANGITQNPYLISVTPTGTRTYSMVSLFSGCNGIVSGNAIVNVYAPPGAFLSSSQTICQGSVTNLSIALTGIAPWDVVYTDGTNTFPVNGLNNANYSFPVNPTSTTTYQLVSVNNGCNGVVAGVSEIDVRPIPSASLSGSASICTGDSTRLTVNLTGVAPWSITYSDGTTPTTITGILNNPFSFAVTPATSRIYTLSNVFATCNGLVSGSASITVNPQAIGFMSGNTTICQGQSAPIQVGLSGGSPWTIVYTDGPNAITVSNITATPYIINVTPGQTRQYNLLSVNSVCAGIATGSATVVVNPVPTATMSGNIGICGGNQAQVSIHLTGVQPFSVTYTNGVTPVTVNNISSSPYVFNVLPGVTTTYTPTAVNATCSGIVSGSTVVTPQPPPTAALSGSQTTCVSSPAQLTVNFTGSGPWDIVYTDGINNFTANGLTQNPAILNVNPGTSQKTYQLLSVFGGCIGTVSGTQVIDVEAKPIASLSAPQGLCNGGSTQFTVSLSGTGPWNFTYTDGTNNFNEIGITGSPYVWNVIPAQTSTWQLVSVSGPYCTGNVVNNPAVVQLSFPPSATLSGGGSTVCAGSGVPLFISPMGTAPFTFTFTDGITPTTVTGIQGDTSIIVFPTDTVMYSAVAISALGCSDTATGQAQVFVIPAPTQASVGADQTLCSSSVNIAANTPTVGTGNWSVIQGSGVIANPNAAFTAVTNLSAGINILQWTIGNQGCVSSDTMILDISIPPTTANAGPDQNICGSVTLLNANAPGSGTGTWSLVSGTATLSDINNPNSAVTGIAPGQTTLMWTISSGICTSTDIMEIFAAPSAPTANAGPDQFICGTTATLSAGNTGINPGLWVLASGGSAVITNPGSANTQVTGLTPGNYTFVWTVYSSGCSNSDTMLLTVIPSPVANFSFTQLGYFATFNDLSQGGITAYNWSFGDGGVSTLQNPQYNYASAGIYVVRLIVTNACRNDTISRILQVYGVNTAEDITIQSQFELYPNPSDQGYMMLNAKGLKGNADYIAFTLRSMSGAEVYSTQIPVEGREALMHKIIPDKLLPKGVYTAEISYDGYTRVLKQIIQ